MALSDYEVVTSEVALPRGGSFTVRGFALPDVVALFRSRGPEIQAFFVKYRRDLGGAPAGFSADIGLQLLDAAPTLVAEIIACAADEPKMVSTAAKLPLTVQLDALEKIAALTFDAEGGPKKFVEAVIRMLAGTTNLMADLNQSKIGSLVSEGK